MSGVLLANQSAASSKTITALPVTPLAIYFSSVLFCRDL